MSNLQRITLACFLAYFIMSGMLSPLGIIAGPMADHFDRPITDITSNFSWLTGGIFFGSLAALVIYDWMKLKSALIALYVIILLCLISLPFQSGLQIIWPALGLVGACCGAGLAGAAITISNAYASKQRASMLIITDGCFSIAGILISWLAVRFLAVNIDWYGAYLVVAGAACITIALCAISSFPNGADHQTVNEINEKEPWPIGAWLCIGALFIYTLSQFSLLLWLPNFAETKLGVPPEDAGLLISRFWTGMLVSQIFVAWWVLKIGVQKTVAIGAVATALSTIAFWSVPQIQLLVVFSFVCGVVNLGLLKVILSLATQMMRVPPPRLVSALLLGATTGTSVSPWISSRIVEATSNNTVLIICTVGYFVVAGLVILAMLLSPEIKLQTQDDAVPDESYA